MSSGRGRGKINTSELKKDDKSWAGPEQLSVSFNNSESAMDEYLLKLDLYRKPVAKDGSCLFRVVSEQIYNTQTKHIRVRFECIDFMRKNKEFFQAFVEGSYEHHLYALKNPKEWGGQVEISALSLLYKYDFIVYQAIDYPGQKVTCNNFKRKILLCYSNGNHYDAVYPLSFKANAAMIQSLLYDIVLDRTFRVVDPDPKRTLTEKEQKEETTTGSPGWTEVRKPKGKTSEETIDRINSIFPDAAKNQKVSWQLQRSFDSTLYRNIELEVWKEFRSDITDFDYKLAAAMQKLRPGDICLATLKESKDVSETIKVKIHEINPDKCIVFSEDERTRYYVQLHDLEPLMNGDAPDYKNLPGYYNKHDDRDNEFQQPKRRGKGSKKNREDEERNRKSENNRGQDGKRYESRTNGKRGPRKENDKRKENYEKSSHPRKPKAESDLKKVDRIDEAINYRPPPPAAPKVVTPVTPEEPPKVAKPAESSAAFWGRMNRTTKPLPNNSNVVNGTVNPTSSIVNNEKPNKSLPIKNDNNNNDNNTNITTNRSNTPDIVVPKQIPGNSREESQSVTSTTNSKPVSSNSQNVNDKLPVVNVQSQSLEESSDTPKQLNIHQQENPNIIISTPPLNDIPTASNIVQENIKTDTDISNFNSIDQLNENLKNIAISSSNIEEPLVSSSSDIVFTQSLISTPTNTMSSFNYSVSNDVSLLSAEDQRLFNLSTQASAKINEVRGNIIASSAKMSSGIIKSTENTTTVTTVLSSSKNDIELVNKNETCSTIEILPNPENEIEFMNSDTISVTSTITSSVSSTVNGYSDIPNLIIPSPNFHELEETDNIQNDLLNGSDLENTNEELLNSSKEKSKKKVSFGTTQIIDNPNHVMTQVAPVNIHPTQTTLTALSEPGKIVLPPEHIEKHLNEFPTNTQDVTNFIQHNHQQQQFVPTFIQSSSGPFYSAIHPNFPMVRMFYANNTLHEVPHNPVNIIPVLSVDPEGKDLPEDITTLRHFYNLGIQWHYMVNQPNNIHLNQPGILPPPVQTQAVHTGTVRPMVMNHDPTQMRTMDCYSPGSQASDVSSHIDLIAAHQAQAAAPFLSNTRIHNPAPQQPNLVHVQHAPTYEEYEIPPRHQRGGITTSRGNARHMNQRHFMNPRGIMGQHQRHRHQVRAALSHQGNHIGNY